jgi:hypothetical protein
VVARTGSRAAVSRSERPQGPRVTGGGRCGSEDIPAVAFESMPTLVLDPRPRELVELIARRRRLGQDLFNELWQGVLHMNPAPRGPHGAIETPGGDSSLGYRGRRAS